MDGLSSFLDLRSEVSETGPGSRGCFGEAELFAHGMHEPSSSKWLPNLSSSWMWRISPLVSLERPIGATDKHVEYRWLLRTRRSSSHLLYGF